MSADRQQLKLYWAASAGAVFGFAMVFVMPVLVGPLIDAFALDEREIGMLFSLELAGIAISTVFVALRTGKRNLRIVGVAGALIACLGQGASMLSAGSIGLYGLCRFATGIGAGAAMASAYAAAAGAKLPERAYAIAQVTVTAVAVALLYLIPQLTEAGDFRAGVGTLFVVFLIFAPAMLALPVTGGAKTIDSAEVSAPRFPYPLLGVLTLVGYALLNIADIGVWTFSERIGTALAVSPQRIGELLAISQVLGLVGCVAAAVVQTRFGRMIPMFGGLIILAVFILGLGHAPSAAIYALCLLPYGAAILFMYPYFLGALAALDEAGSWTALSGSVSAFGMATGPLIAGYMAVHYSYREMSWVMSVLVMLSLALMVWVLRAFPDHRTNHANLR